MQLLGFLAAQLPPHSSISPQEEVEFIQVLLAQGMLANLVALPEQAADELHAGVLHRAGRLERACGRALGAQPWCLLAAASEGSAWQRGTPHHCLHPLLGADPQQMQALLTSVELNNGHQDEEEELGDFVALLDCFDEDIFDF